MSPPLHPTRSFRKLLLTPNTRAANENYVRVVLEYPPFHCAREFCAVDHTEMGEMSTAIRQEACCVSAYEFTCPLGSQRLGGEFPLVLQSRGGRRD
jgi:hypothetical protein